jgi:hypothetical protein
MEKTMDMGEGQPPYKYTTTQPDMKVLFATAVNDRAAFDKLVGIAMSERKNMPSAPEIHYKLDKDWFAASNSQEQVDKFLSGATATNTITDKISGKPFGMYINLQKNNKFSKIFDQRQHWASGNDRFKYLAGYSCCRRFLQGQGDELYF